jgi:hypothetical protein
MWSAPRPLLCSGAVNTSQQQKGCFLRGPCQGVTKTTKKIVEVSWVSRRQPSRIWAWERRNWGSGASELFTAAQWRWRSGREEMCAIIPWYLECVIQWGCCSSCVKIRCQETNSGNCNRLRTLVGVTVNCKVWRLAVALRYLQLRVECIRSINPISNPNPV